MRRKREIGPVDLIVILAILVLLFGGKTPPDIGNRLAEGIRHFHDFLTRGGPGGPAAA